MNFVLLALLSLPLTVPADKSLLIDFGSSPGKTQEWLLLSDNVMGGVSRSTVEYTDNSVVLTGTISLDNYGGFSSIKTRYNGVDLSAYKGVKIRFKSSNQRFAFTLEDSQNWTRPNYKKEFAASRDNTWEEVMLSFSDFKEVVIGEPTGKSFDSARLKNIVRMGIMTSEKKAGPFSLEVDYIEFVR